jgi:hypothetical protein
MLFNVHFQQTVLTSRVMLFLKTGEPGVFWLQGEA